MAMGCATVGLTAILPKSELVHVSCVLVMPFLLAIVFTGDFLVAMTLVWLSEGFLGVGGNWLRFGALPGRGLLLACLLGTYVIYAAQSDQDRGRETSRKLWVLFYGILLPCSLVGYSVGVKGVALSGALSDVMRFLTILAFFPLYYCLKKLPWFMVGWLLGISTLLSILFIILVAAPTEARIILLDKWIAGFCGKELNVNYVEMQRAFFTPLLLCIIGLFLGLVLAFNSTGVLAKILGYCAMVVAVSAFVVNFARGPILGIAVAILFLLFALVRSSRIANAAFLTALVLCLFSGSYLFTIKYLPASMGKWNLKGMDIIDVVDEGRLEQTQLMLKAWLENPLLGKGVGCPIKGYSRTDEDEGLAFEVQYPMVLYRTGIIGFVVILAPFFIFIFKTYKLIRRLPVRLYNANSIINLAMCCSTVAMLTASVFNPYLASSMAVLYMGLYIASDSAIGFPLQRKRTVP